MVAKRARGIALPPCPPAPLVARHCHLTLVRPTVSSQ